jgi:hypothetical protein
MVAVTPPATSFESITVSARERCRQMLPVAT